MCLLTLLTVDPAIPDAQGQMPLDAAKANQKEDIVRLLETHNLSPQTASCDNVTSLSGKKKWVVHNPLMHLAIHVCGVDGGNDWS